MHGPCATCSSLQLMAWMLILPSVGHATNKSKFKIWKIYNACVLYKPNNKSWQPENENEIVRRKHRMQVRANTGTACTSELREPSARCRPPKNTCHAPVRRIPQTNAAARRWPAMTAPNTLPHRTRLAYAPGKKCRIQFRTPKIKYNCCIYLNAHISNIFCNFYN